MYMGYTITPRNYSCPSKISKVAVFTARVIRIRNDHKSVRIYVVRVFDEIRNTVK